MPLTMNVSTRVDRVSAYGGREEQLRVTLGYVREGEKAKFDKYKTVVQAEEVRERLEEQGYSTLIWKPVGHNKSRAWDEKDEYYEGDFMPHHS